MSTPPSNDNTRAKAPENGLNELIKALGGINQRAAPVHLWDPPYCGKLDIVIQADGRWDYNKTPIGREKLVRLFASVLKREGDEYFLVTPVEKIGIEVKDAPFIAIKMEVHGKGKEQVLAFETNVGDVVIAGPDNPLRFQMMQEGESLLPYVHVRRGLEARLSRPVYYELANLAECKEGQAGARTTYGIWSQGVFFPLETDMNET